MSANKTKVALVTTPLLQKRGNHPLFPPLGLAYMAAVLEQNGFEVKIFDCPVCELDHEKLRSRIRQLPTHDGWYRLDDAHN